MTKIDGGRSGPAIEDTARLAWTSSRAPTPGLPFFQMTFRQTNNRHHHKQDPP